MNSIVRAHNFSAGPAVLPLAVLEEAQEHFTSLPGLGMSVVELGHRSAAVQQILQDTAAMVRRLADIPADYELLFLPGGARLQFATLALNLLAAGRSADYIDTGLWSRNAIKEAAAVGHVRVAASGQPSGYQQLPAVGAELDPEAAYVHITSNNTVEGTQFTDLPETIAPLVVDATSDVFSRPINVSRVGAIYAAAQKNLGVAGVTLLVIRKELCEQPRSGIPPIFNYAVHAANKSSYSTPPVFAIYIMGLVMRWLESVGGLAGIDVINRRKAARMYAEIDRSGFYTGVAASGCRSLMNVTFRIADQQFERPFVEQAEREGFSGLAGHPGAGGLRASLYNGQTEDAVAALVAFMQEFERTHG